MTNYYMSDYSSHNRNAYVGGDGYNYIINGNYATGFFVLSMGFLLTGTVFVTSGVFINKTMEITANSVNYQPISSEELPDL